MERKLGSAVRIVPGGVGEFTVLVNGAKLWDKHERGRFPEEKEILSTLP
jgi:selT/selW/selH-like putative selenoprotein